MKKILILFLIFQLFGCSQHQDKTLIGIETGNENIYKIKEVRDPPVFHNELVQFAEIEYPNQEFDFVGIAYTSNDKKYDSSEIKFSKENVIWAIFLNGKFKNEEKQCNEKEFKKLYTAITERWKIDYENIVYENIKNNSYSKSMLLQSDKKFFQIDCFMGNKTIILQDLQVIEKYGNEKAKQTISDALKNFNDYKKRKL